MSETCSGVYREVARYCGDDVARALHEHYAGQAISVPKRPADDHPLVRRIGADGATRLCAHFGGSWLELPIRFLFGRALRSRILTLRAQGMKTCDIVREVRCTRRQVALVLKSARVMEEEQPLLF